LKASQLATPVLFLIFNRLDTTRQVFETLKLAKPRHLYIASDGARENCRGEAEKVQAVREYVIEQIDWDCEIKTLFRKTNLGCGPGVKLAIDWFFEHEEMGIILEDDVCPVNSFFRFCEELLSKYHFDERIGMICGNNHVGFQPKQESYFFSRYKGCWGWATWKRAWKNMDFEMNWMASEYKAQIIDSMGFEDISSEYWKNKIGHIQKEVVNTWAWKWYFSIASQGQLCLFPKYNLAANIGFGGVATHTFEKPRKEFLETEEISFPLNHPKYIMANDAHDKLFENKMIKSILLIRLLPRWVKVIIKKILKRN
jgi:hypothetical protein